MFVWFARRLISMSSPFSQDLDVVFEGFDAGFNNDLEKGRELRKSSEAKYFRAV